MTPERRTPSRKHVRQVHAAQHSEPMAKEHQREFDQWLATHDADDRANKLIAVAASPRRRCPTVRGRLNQWHPGRSIHL